MQRQLFPILLFLTPAVEAQVGLNEPSGVASALAAGVSLDPAGRGGPEATRVKAPLNQTLAPAAWSLTDFPGAVDYSLFELFGSLAQVIEVDAMTTGNDLIPSVSSTGTPVLGGSWMAVVVSVDNDAQGLPGSAIQERRNGPHARKSPGADLVSYYFEESTGIHPALRGSTFVEQASEVIRLAGEEDIDGLDFGLGVQSHAQPLTPTLLFPIVGKFYFSLSPECLVQVNNAVNGNFARHGGTWVPADAATIYRMTWNETDREWSDREVYLLPGMLDLDPLTDDVDALAINEYTGVTIFSTQPVLGRSQLRVYDGAGETHDLTEVDGKKTTEKLGTIDDVDNIDAACIIDPEQYVFGTHLGSPTGQIHPGASAPVSLAMTRSGRDFDQPRLHFQLTGWPDKPTDMRVDLLVSYDYVPGTPWTQASWSILAKGVKRSAKDPVVEWSLPIPGSAASEFAVGALLTSGSGADKVFAGSWITQFNLY